ncbi:O-antigen ligase family protein [Roseateles sp. MS654]|uniref:O-antigen ligase family protein n=1 Tax=Roseateles sp. MS654 TaxID=3412685 RepID=UPI003C2FC8A9
MKRLAAVLPGALWALPFVVLLLRLPYSAHDLSRLAQVLLLLAVSLCWVLQRPATRPGARRLQWISAALAMSVVASCVHAAEPMIALREVLLWVALLVSALWLASQWEDSGIDVALQGVTRGMTFYGLAVFAMWSMMALTGEPMMAWEALFGFDNPRFLNHVLTPALALAAIAGAQSDRSNRRWAWAAVGMGGVMLYLAFGRATPLALAIGVAAALAVWGRRVLRYALALALPLVLGAVFMAVLWSVTQPSGSELESGKSASLYARLYLAHQAEALWRSSPWLGVGPMHFSHAYNAEAAHPHNVYLQCLAELGLPATLLLAGLTLYGLRCWVRDLRQVDGDRLPHVAGLFTGAVAVLMDALASGNFVMPLSQLWIAVTLGMMIAVRRREKNGNALKAPTRHCAGTAMCVGRCLVVLGVAWLAVQASMEMAASSKPALPTVTGAKHTAGERLVNPRFWTHGWF